MSFAQSFEHSEELFAAALAEFAEHGYAQASINAILAAAGMSKGQFYYHFGSKEELYSALVEVVISKKRAFLQDELEPEDTQQDIFSRLQHQIRLGLAFARAHPAINRFANSFTREVGNPIYHTVLERFNFAQDRWLNQMVELAYQRGELRTDLPLPFIKRAVSHMFSHAAEIADLSRPEEIEQQLAYLVALLRSGLAR